MLSIIFICIVITFEIVYRSFILVQNDQLDYILLNLIGKFASFCIDIQWLESFENFMTFLFSMITDMSDNFIENFESFFDDLENHSSNHMTSTVMDQTMESFFQ